jgi:hypothetical protein
MRVRDVLCAFLVTLCIASFASAWTFVMVKDLDMVETTDIIIEGQVTSYGPSLNSNLPATDYQVLDSKNSN